VFARPAASAPAATARLAGVRGLDAATGRALATLDVSDAKEEPHYMAFGPGGKLLAPVCADGKVRVWDIVPARGP
jgi:hypothetical protein